MSSCVLRTRIWRWSLMYELLVVGLLSQACGAKVANSGEDAIAVVDASEVDQVDAAAHDAAPEVLGKDAIDVAATPDVVDATDASAADVAADADTDADVADVPMQPDVSPVDIGTGCTQDTDCTDASPCTTDTCTAGKCTSKPADGTLCDDGNVCTDGDTCASGNCTPGSVLTCDDGDPCTVDSCDLTNGCSHKSSDAACSDGDGCTAGDQCLVGLCIGATVDCDDKNACTDDSCDSTTGCNHASNTTGCSDGNSCTAIDICADGACKPGNELGCDDNNVCTTDSCDPVSGCQHVAQEGGCDDGNACTSGDACNAGQCAPGAIVTCDDGVFCTKDSCDLQTGCVITNADGLPCDDGQKCSVNDACLNGGCAGVVPKCGDNNPCTDDLCDDSVGCVHKANTSKCDDSNACSNGDVCGGGKCNPGATLDCDDGNACTLDACDSGQGGCTHAPTNLGNVCDQTGCNWAVCLADGTCGNYGIAAAPVGSTCSLSLGKTGMCTGTTFSTANGNGCVECLALSDCPVDPSWNAQCFDMQCANGKCDFKNYNAGQLCDDGDPCTGGDNCSASYVCAGVALTCDDSNPCTTDSCGAPSGCAHTPIKTAACGWTPYGSSFGLACTKSADCGTGMVCQRAGCSTTGACVFLPASCSSVGASPVCGCDGNNYASKCEALVADVGVKSDWACGQAPNNVFQTPCQEGVAGSCPAGKYCNGPCAGEGLCTSLNSPMCLDIIVTVKGCNGTTYIDDCGPPGVGTPAIPVGASSISCKGATSSNCAAGSQCLSVSGGCYGGLYGHCMPPPVACPNLTEPVCGCDGKTYNNACNALGAGVSVYEQGACAAGLQFCVPGSGSCPSGSYCQGDCGFAFGGTMGICTPVPSTCPATGTPVCGCYGVTYANACLLAQAQAGKLFDGPCP